MAMTIGSGITIGGQITIASVFKPVLSLDAGNPESYPGSGSTWTDLVSARTFTLYNDPTYNSANGGYLEFDPPSNQYALCASSLPTLNNWTVEVWHYYSGTNSGSSPCIVTEALSGTINYTLGCTADNSPNLQAGFFNGGWQATANNYTLTPGAWYQIVGTCNNNQVCLYINGILTRSTGRLASPPVSSNAGIFLMHRWDYPQFWGGNLAIVRIYDSDIGSTGVTQTWNANRARFGL